MKTRKPASSKTAPAPAQEIDLTAHEELVVAFVGNWAQLVRGLRAARQAAATLRDLATRFGDPDRPAGKGAGLTFAQLAERAAQVERVVAEALASVERDAPPFVIDMAARDE